MSPCPESVDSRTAVGRSAGERDCRVASVDYRIEVLLDERANHVALRVTYETSCGLRLIEQVHFDAPKRSRLRRLAEGWWADRSGTPCPTDSIEALQVARSGGLPCPSSVRFSPAPGSLGGSVLQADLGGRDLPRSTACRCHPDSDVESAASPTIWTLRSGNWLVRYATADLNAFVAAHGRGGR